MRCVMVSMSSRVELDVVTETVFGEVGLVSFSILSHFLGSNLFIVVEVSD